MASLRTIDTGHVVTDHSQWRVLGEVNQLEEGCEGILENWTIVMKKQTSLSAAISLIFDVMLMTFANNCVTEKIHMQEWVGLSKCISHLYVT